MAIKNKKYMDYGQYQNKTEAMTNDELHLTILNAKDVIAANPRGVNNDYYADEINYCAMELSRRREQGKISDIDWRRYRNTTFSWLELRAKHPRPQAGRK